MDKIFVSWDDYIKQLETLSTIAGHRGEMPQVIVGLNRGGLIPALCISHALNLPMITFDPHILHSSGEEREPVKLSISPPVIKDILIVDDIADTGKTFLKCTKFFKNRGFNCVTMSVYINETTTMFKPDVSLRESNKKWVVFPYEKE